MGSAYGEAELGGGVDGGTRSRSNLGGGGWATCLASLLEGG